MSRTPVSTDRVYRVSVSNRQRSLKLDSRKLIRAARNLLRAEEVLQAEISIALLDDESIHRLNLQYLNHDYPPDVLSFVFDVTGGENNSDPCRRGAGKILGGEILIGVDEAIRGGKKFGWSAENEVLLYLVHGLLHICGYDDLTPAEKKIMRRREKDILALWNLAPPYLHRSHTRRTPSGSRSADVSTSRKRGRSR